MFIKRQGMPKKNSVSIGNHTRHPRPIPLNFLIATIAIHY